MALSPRIKIYINNYRSRIEEKGEFQEYACCIFFLLKCCQTRPVAVSFCTYSPITEIGRLSSAQNQNLSNFRKLALVLYKAFGIPISTT